MHWYIRITGKDTLLHTSSLICRGSAGSTEIARERACPYGICWFLVAWRLGLRYSGEFVPPSLSPSPLLSPLILIMFCPRLLFVSPHARKHVSPTIHIYLYIYTHCLSSIMRSAQTSKHMLPQLKIVFTHSWTYVCHFLNIYFALRSTYFLATLDMLVRPA